MIKVNECLRRTVVGLLWLCEDQPQFGAGLGIAIDVNAGRPVTVFLCQPAQAALTGAIAKMAAPGAQIVIGYRTAHRVVVEWHRMPVSLLCVSGNLPHQPTACFSRSAITQRARFNLISPSMPFTARVRVERPLVLKPGRPPLVVFS